MPTSHGPTEPLLDTMQCNELAEGVEIHLRIAGPYVRVLAYVLDYLIRVGICILAYLGLLLFGFVAGLQVAGGLAMLVLFFLIFFYYVLFEAGPRGASPGKRIMGLRVVDISGAPITYGQAFIRNLMRVVDSMPLMPSFPLFVSYGFGLTSTLFTKRFQRLGDLLANTVVVYERLPAMNVSGLPPVLASRAPNVPLTREEQVAVMAFRERGGMWSEARRVELANHACELTGKSGEAGMTRLLGVAHWLGEKHS